MDRLRRTVFLYGTNHVGKPHPAILEAFARADVGTFELEENFDIPPYPLMKKEFRDFIRPLAASRKNKPTHLVDLRAGEREDLLHRERRLIGNCFFNWFGFGAADKVEDMLATRLTTYIRDLHQAERIAKLARELKPGQTLVHVGGGGHVTLPLLLRKKLAQDGITVKANYRAGMRPDYLHNRLQHLLSRFLPQFEHMEDLETAFPLFLKENRDEILRIAQTKRAAFLIIKAFSQHVGYSQVKRMANAWNALEEFIHKLPDEKRVALLQETNPAQLAAKLTAHAREYANQTPKIISSRKIQLVRDLTDRLAFAAKYSSKWPAPDHPLAQWARLLPLESMRQASKLFRKREKTK